MENKTKKVWEKVENKPIKKDWRSPMEKAVEKKQQGIKQSMDAKAEQFSIQGSASDATEILKTFYPELICDEIEHPEFPSKEERIKYKWNYWRQYFYHMRTDFEKPDEPFIK